MLWANFLRLAIDGAEVRWPLTERVSAGDIAPSLPPAPDGSHEVDLARRFDRFAEAQRADLAIHGHRQVGPQAAAVGQPGANAGPPALEIFDDLPDRRAGGLDRRLAAGQLAQHRRNVHLGQRQSIYCYTGTGENYTLTYLTGQTLKEPFTMTAVGTTALLAAVGVTGLGAVNSFQYGLGTGEMTQTTTPLGGSLAWTYQSNTHAGPGRTYREVQTRSTPSIDGNTSAWNVTFDNNAYVHGTAKVSDVRAGSQKVWTSQTAAGPLLGLTTAYEEGPAGGTALLHKDYTWT